MKKAFVYYSLSGNGDLVAEALRPVCESVPVKTKKAMPKSYALQILAGGFGAAIGRREPIEPLGTDLADFDEIIIGSPVWNGRLACPVNTLLELPELKDKPLRFVLYSGGGTAPKAEAGLRAAWPGAEIIHLKEPKKYPEEMRAALSKLLEA